MELAVLQNAEQLMYQRTLFVNAFPDMITLNTWVREVWEEVKDVLEEAELAFALGQPGPRIFRGPVKIPCAGPHCGVGWGISDFLPCPIPWTGPRICGAPFFANSGAPLSQVPAHSPLRGPAFSGAPLRVPARMGWVPVYFVGPHFLV